MASDQEHAKAAVKSLASALGIEDLEFDPNFIRVGAFGLSWDHDLWSVTAPMKHLPEEALPSLVAILPKEVLETATASLICRNWRIAVSEMFRMLLHDIVELVIEAEALAQEIGIPNPGGNLN